MSKMLSPRISLSSLRYVVYFFVILLILSGCGENPISTTLGSQKTAQIPQPMKQHTPTPTPPSLVAGGPINFNVSTSSYQLHIQSPAYYPGFSCPHYQNTLVLRSDELTYGSDDLHQMESYTSSYYNNPMRNVLTPPKTLQWLVGSPADSSCGVDLQVTNTGVNPIAITHLDIRLEDKTQQNTAQYRLIDLCSMLSPPQNQGCARSGGGPIPQYEYDVSLHAGVTGTLIMPDKLDQFVLGQATPFVPVQSIIIDPSQTVEITINFISTGTSENLIYFLQLESQIVSQLSNSTSSSVFAPLQLRSTLAFANINQFTCYTLRGTTFQHIQAPLFVGDSEDHLCM